MTLSRKDKLTALFGPCFFRHLQVVIYNWSGLPNKDTILQQLVVMLNAAEKIITEDEHERTFGHLILVFRDVTGKAAGIEALVLGEEGTGKLKFAEQRHVSERNRIRQGIKEAFKSITVHTMPNPHPSIGGDVFTMHAAPRALYHIPFLVHPSLNVDLAVGGE